jgi:hypothetical protein
MDDGPREDELVLHLIYTPRTFRYLRMFTTSLVTNSRASYRLVANGCDDNEVNAIAEYADRRPGRVEACRLSTDTMVPHGVALDELFDTYDVGAYFCFIDTDVKARGPFLAAFLAELRRHTVVTSGRVAWADDATLPPGSRDLAGRHFVDTDGFVYGSSYAAFYERDALRRVRAKYGVSFRASAHTNLSPEIQHDLAAIGRVFDLYDTAKVTNILLQANGFSVEHIDHDNLFHVGGISQYLSHPRPVGDAAPGQRPWFATSESGARRWDFAQWAAECLVSLVDGEPMPEVPADDPDRAALLRAELQSLAAADVHA